MRFQVVVGQLADAAQPEDLALTCTFTFADNNKLVAYEVTYLYSDSGIKIVGKYVC